MGQPGLQILLLPDTDGVLQRCSLFKEPLHTGRNALLWFVHQMGGLFQLLLSSLHFQKSTSAAHNGKAGGILAAVRGKNLDQTDLAGSFHVRCAAGTDINAFDGDDADLPVDLLLAAVVEVLQDFFRRVFAGDWDIAPDRLIGLFLKGKKLLCRENSARVQRHGVVAQPEADILISPQAVEKAGENVLSGMILHIGIAVLPVENPVDVLTRCKERSKSRIRLRGINPQNVCDDPVSRNLHVRNRKPGECAAVRGLSSLLREKERSRQNDQNLSGSSLTGREDGGIKFSIVGLRIIQPDGFLHNRISPDRSILAYPLVYMKAHIAA